MSVREAALLLGVSAASLYRAVHESRSPVKTIQVGARVLVVTADLRRVLHLDGRPERE
jgi:excisionase family DNA binding protein